MFFLWLNISCGVLMLAIFFLILIFDRKNFRVEIQNVRLIVLAAILIALAVTLNTIPKLVFNSPIFEVKLGNFVLALIGFFCGGILGFLSGAAADFLGLIIFSSGTPALFWTLTSILWCILPYYLVKLLSKIYVRNWTIYFYLVFAYAATLLLITASNPIVLKYMYNLRDGWWVLYLPRIIKYPFDVAVNGLSLIVVYRIFTKSVSLRSKIYQPQQHKFPELNLQFKSEEDISD